MTFGHCGIDWMHSLLDSHKQILIIPALSFYRCWKVLNLQNISTVDEMYSNWYQYITEYIGPNSANEQKKLLHTETESELFFSEFRKQLEDTGIDRIATFWAIHGAYAYAKNINTGLIQSVVVHELFHGHLKRSIRILRVLIS